MATFSREYLLPITWGTYHAPYHQGHLSRSQLPGAIYIKRPHDRTGNFPSL